MQTKNKKLHEDLDDVGEVGVGEDTCALGGLLHDSYRNTLKANSAATCPLPTAFRRRNCCRLLQEDEEVCTAGSGHRTWRRMEDVRQ